MSDSGRLITPALVDLYLAPDDKSEALRALAQRLVAEGRVTDLDGFLADIAAREAQAPTGLGDGIGIPHCRSAHVTRPSLAFGRSSRGLDFDAPDGLPADLVFMIAAPDGADDAHLQILASLARRLMDPEFTGALRAATDPGAVAALVNGEPTAEPAAEPPVRAADTALRLVAVTSCPTGIAHTYMAAQALEQAAARAGAQIHVETQGSAGSTPLDPAVIAAADAVIFAHDVEVRDKARFAGKPTVDVGVKAGVNRADDLVAQAAELAKAAGPTRTAPVTTASVRKDEHWGNRLRQYLMTGVSYMIPFVAAGGLLIALGFAIGGYEIASAPSVVGHFDWASQHSWAAMLFQAGKAAFGFLVPILSGYIAYAIADRAALAAGVVGGAISLTVGAGFLGGIASGLIAGFLVRWMVRWRVPRSIAGIMPVVVIPLLSVAVVGFLMFVVIGSPIASVMSGLTDWLNSLSGTNAILLGVLLGAMMAFDMGGPLNKVAYTFAAGALTTAGATPDAGSLKVMAAVMAAGMTPPLGLALATVVRGRLFTREERENGKAAWVLGASFITEGAIPFAAADPLRVIPSAIVGSMTAGGLSMAFGSTLRAPHGGIWVLPLIGSPVLYVLSIAAGTVVTAALVVLLKGLRRPAPATAVPVVDERVAVPAGV
ncbi:fructose-specific PTS transporter subunit EIIC [Kitasatospora atroaurantiaca]|uniref:PTS system D-fructose-specific IIA component (F1P-forming) (Frc family) /PTS system D-fructose-specific IIB component (F1P-forming) (Frc family) /PTS system D-fructose-specific IIC component (F1P-f... n=1 Tax=Kitasatospora atroaurantiaca TaxID=285545 RepID=A0A561EL54_9ACTN|nr:fructose-specific PTS transporter subunit EIIC [Kitasatospora atroaurantiaca]TWE16289.1 PTS system D-fructose-specific IIA component (F1P-forming) (Frc family) /PTS system D-fructose-specific IIB component (F1P-forming) (Frc family) /PTS system D-fructose-specific IIC component (F1P-forming) (Frc family) [Kitasatospora atroaurantiaca]